MRYDLSRNVSASAAKLLLLTFAGVFIEVAMLVSMLARGERLWAVPTVLGAYHAGYLLARLPIVSQNHIVCRSLLLISTLALALSVYDGGWILIASSVLMFSTSLQAARRVLKPSARLTSESKNVTKAIAMAAGAAGVLPAPWLTLLVLLLIPGLFVGSTAALVKGRAAPQVLAAKDGKPLLWFEHLHHAHYFAYCYTFWILLGRDFAPLIGPAFIIGWIGYFILERFFRERSSWFSTRLLQTGHLLCAGALLGMLTFGGSGTGWVLIFWFLTGIGGGTSFMLGNVRSPGNRELFEDTGHVLGCLGAALAILATGKVEASLALGVFFALAAVAVLVPGKVQSFVGRAA